MRKLAVSLSALAALTACSTNGVDPQGTNSFHHHHWRGAGAYRVPPAPPPTSPPTTVPASP